MDTWGSDGPDPLVPLRLAEAAACAAAEDDAVGLMFRAKLDAAALLRVVEEVEVARPGALESVAEEPVPDEHVAAYRARFVATGRRVADLLGQHVPRRDRSARAAPDLPLGVYRLVWTSGGRREGMRHALDVGAWPTGIRRCIAEEEAEIRESCERGPMAPTASPRKRKDARIAALREALALVAPADGSAPPHPLDAEDDLERHAPSAEQRRHLDLIRQSSKNWFDGALVADDLAGRAHLWRAAVITGNRDVVHIAPRDGVPRLLECLAHTWQADRCEWVAVGRGHDAAEALVRCDPALAAGGAEQRVLRLWWD